MIYFDTVVVKGYRTENISEAHEVGFVLYSFH